MCIYWFIHRTHIECPLFSQLYVKTRGLVYKWRRHILNWEDCNLFMKRIFNLESMGSLEGGPRTPANVWRLHICAFSRERVCSFHWILRASTTLRRVRTTTLRGQVLHTWKVQWQVKKVFSKELGKGGEDPWSYRRLDKKEAHGSRKGLKRTSWRRWDLDLNEWVELV